MLKYLSLDIICYSQFSTHSFPHATPLVSCSLLRTDNVWTDKHPRIFSCQMDTLVYVLNYKLSFDFVGKVCRVRGISGELGPS